MEGKTNQLKSHSTRPDQDTKKNLDDIGKIDPRAWQHHSSLCQDQTYQDAYSNAHRLLCSDQPRAPAMSILDKMPSQPSEEGSG